MPAGSSELELRVAALEAAVAQLQAEMLRRPRYVRRDRDELFDADELGLDPEEDEEDF